MGGIFSGDCDPNAKQVPTALQVRNVDTDQYTI